MGILPRKRKEAPAEPDGPVVLHRHVQVAIDPVGLPGDLAIPADASGIVIFAHGSGSSRLSPRNVAVAGALNRSGLTTLLLDLLTPAEAEDRSNVFDVERQAGRLVALTKWIGTWPDVGTLPVGYFGASTGAASALLAATRMPVDVSAVVSRGGRPDLAGEALGRVTCPTLLIVGGGDTEVLELNREAERRLHGEHRLEVVPGATHLFEEPGALERVTELATEWFAKHLGGAPRRERASLPRTLASRGGRAAVAAGHEVLEHTADVGVRAWGGSMEEAFEQAAWGLVDLAGVRGEGPGRRRAIAVSGADAGALLVDFLNELILLFDTEAVRVATITVRGVTDADLEAEVELVASSREGEGVCVKAATYHQLRVEQRPAGGVETRVFLDV